MPVVRRADDDRVHARISEQFPVIEVALHVGVLAAFDAFLEVRLVNVAHRRDLHARHRDNGVKQIAAPRAEANATHADCLGWRFAGKDRWSRG